MADADRAGGDGGFADVVDPTERAMGRQRVARDANAFLKQNCIGTLKSTTKKATLGNDPSNGRSTTKHITPSISVRHVERKVFSAYE